MSWCMGIDIGSATSKGVVISDGGKVKAYHMLASGVNYQTTAQRLREELLAGATLLPDDIGCTVTTGRGSGIIPFSDRHVADILCCGRGINHVLPAARTVIDVQEQSSQVIKLDEKGRVINFAINEMCAGGSGYFLKVVANVLQVDLEDVGPVSLKSKNPVTFTTGCAVFGESEAISRAAEGIQKEDILGGVHKALAETIMALVKKIGIEKPCAISGGGGLNIGLIKRLDEYCIQLLVPPQPQIVNALGAAIFAVEQIN